MTGIVPPAGWILAEGRGPLTWDLRQRNGSTISLILGYPCIEREFPSTFGYGGDLIRYKTTTRPPAYVGPLACIHGRGGEKVLWWVGTEQVEWIPTRTASHQ